MFIITWNPEKVTSKVRGSQSDSIRLHCWYFVNKLHLLTTSQGLISAVARPQDSYTTCKAMGKAPHHTTGRKWWCEEGDYIGRVFIDDFLGVGGRTKGGDHDPGTAPNSHIQRALMVFLWRYCRGARFGEVPLGWVHNKARDGFYWNWLACMDVCI